MEKHCSLEESTSAAVCRRKVFSPYTCGGCRRTYNTIAMLHAHLLCHKEGGSYHYNSNSKTAFPKYDSKCTETQTDLTRSCNILNFCESKNVDTKYVETQAHEFRLSDQQNRFINGTQHMPYKINYDMVNKSHEPQLHSETGDPDKQQSVVIKTEALDTCTTVATDCVFKDFVENNTDQSKRPVQEIVKSIKEKMPHQHDNKDRPLKIFTTYFKRKPRSDNKDPDWKPKVCISNDDHPSSDTDDFEHKLNTANKLNPTKIETKRYKLKINKNCTKCDKIFSKLGLFKKHLSEVHGEQPWICSKCGKTYSTNVELKTHLDKERYHQPAHKCNYCGSILDSYHSLTQHKLEKHVNKLSIYRCLECQKQFVNMSKYKEHMDSVHCENPVLLICETCGFQSTKKDTMKTHKVKHAGQQHACPECSYTSYSKKNLSHHMKVHSDKKDHVCYICGKSFRLSMSLKRHLKVHSGERTYKCTLCPKAFTTCSGYIRHKKVHTQDKCHTCQYCDKTFHTRGNCNAHMRQHTGDKPFVCDLCGAGFTHNVSKKNHMMKAH